MASNDRGTGDSKMFVRFLRSVADSPLSVSKVGLDFRMKAVRTQRFGKRGKTSLYILAEVVATAAANQMPVASGNAIPVTDDKLDKEVPTNAAENLLKLKARLDAMNPNDMTAADKIAHKRLQRAAWTENLQQQASGKDYFLNMTRVPDGAPVDTDTCLTVRVRGANGEVYNEVLHMQKEELSHIRDWLLNIDDDHIRQAMPDGEGERLVAMKLISPNDYVREALTKIANKYDTVREWLFRSADENHPLWDENNRIKKELLPPGWTTINLKGSGEAPILKEDLAYTDRIQDAYFWRKVDRASPIDRRVMGAEYDVRRNPNGWIFDALARKFNAVRPTDLDKEYFFDLPKGDEDVWSPDTSHCAKRYLINDTVVARVFGNVPSQDRIASALSHREILDIGLRAKLVKTSVEGGDVGASDKSSTQVPQQ